MEKQLHGENAARDWNPEEKCQGRSLGLHGDTSLAKAGARMDEFPAPRLPAVPGS
ncbi:hypothetical protein P7K49_009701 [Saguinus oedipus]|uniref:Uncharacterized protein n=1 Tax=Saguinus oedipus TaxID=9490 RepID=A0ABQ9VKQ7_SAGOE|nr:hypothetical protein P7K49_009701 [Saguinus oedipus]